MFKDGGCASPKLVGNGYCDEENKSSDCGCDGGDCTVDTEQYSYFLYI